MRKWPIGIFAFILLFATISSVLALGPRSHVHVLDEICGQPGSSPDKTLCCVTYKSACAFGMLEVDRDVFEYATDFHKYQVDHQWNTNDQCFAIAAQKNDQEMRAVCIGEALHLAMDGVSHNEMVPDQVKAWGVISEPLAHIFKESAVDDKYADTTTEAGDYLTQANIDKYCGGSGTLFYSLTGRNSHSNCIALANAVASGGTYQTIFLVGPIMKFGYQAFIKFSGLLPMMDWEPYHQDALTYANDVLNGEKSLAQAKFPDPTGYKALDLANFGYNLWSTALIVLGIIAIPLIIIFGRKLFNKKGKKRR